METVGIIALVALVIAAWLGRKWLNQNFEKWAESHNLQEISLLREVALLVVRGVEFWARGQLKNRGVKVPSEEKMDKAMEALTDRFPHLGEEEAHVLLESALADLVDSEPTKDIAKPLMDTQTDVIFSEVALSNDSSFDVKESSEDK